MKNYATVAATRLFIASIALTTIAALAADAAPNISGTWTTKFDSQVGEQNYTYTFKVDGGKLTGHAKSNLGEGDLSDARW